VDAEGLGWPWAATEAVEALRASRMLAAPRYGAKGRQDGRLQLALAKLGRGRSVALPFWPRPPRFLGRAVRCLNGRHGW
jgi:hypothetical protein